MSGSKTQPGISPVLCTYVKDDSSVFVEQINASECHATLEDARLSNRGHQALQDEATAESQPQRAVVQQCVAIFSREADDNDGAAILEIRIAHLLHDLIFLILG